MKLAEVKAREIEIIMEIAERCEKIKVWGTFHHVNSGKSFQCYFNTVEKASIYYNKKITEAMQGYLALCKIK